MYVHMKRQLYEGTEMTWDDVDIARVANILPAVLLLHFYHCFSLFNILSILLKVLSHTFEQNHIIKVFYLATDAQ
jgi:hypothetical protein